MKKILFFVVIGLSVIGKSAFAVEFKCVGKEKGINSMTGRKRVIPVSYHIEIIKNSARIKELDHIDFSVHENRTSYSLKASIEKKKKYNKQSRILGEYALLIDKKTGLFKGKSWLFSPNNRVTQEGQCKRIDGGN